MNNTKKKLIILPIMVLVLFMVASPLVSASNHEIKVFGCQELNVTNMIYILHNNISNAVNCFPISAGNVTLDLNGYSINGTNSYGVQTGDYSVIKNGAIYGFLYGIGMRNSFGSLITNVSIVNSRVYAISLYSSSNNTIIGNDMRNGNYLGITVSSSSNNNFIGNNITGYEDGIHLSYGSSNIFLENSISHNSNLGIKILDDSSKNILINNTLKWDGLYGITMYNGTNNLIIGNHIENSFNGIYFNQSINNTVYDNYFNNSNNILNYKSSSTFNLPKTRNQNIIGGNFTGGNFWAEPNGTGFSQTCADLDRDGFCDSLYFLNSNDTDFLPYHEFIPKEYPKPLNLVIVNASMCKETDFGFDYSTKGNMVGNFFWLDQATNKMIYYNGTFEDSCLDNTTLAEGICGSSVAPSLSSLAGVLTVDCRLASYPNSGCYNGACVKDISLPKIGYSYLVRATNFRTIGGTDRTTFQYKQNRSWVPFKRDVGVNSIFSLEDMNFQVLSIQGRSVKFALTNGVFDRLYHKNGDYIKIDLNAIPTQDYSNVIYNKSHKIIGNISAHSFLNNISYVVANSSLSNFDFTPGSGTYAYFNDFNLKTSTYDIAWIYTNSSSQIIDWGKNSTNGLALSSSFTLTFNDSQAFYEGSNDYFLASWYPGV